MWEILIIINTVECVHTPHTALQVCELYHFTDELTKDMREGRGWYAAWDVWRRLLFIILFHAGVYFNSSLLSVSTHTNYNVS